MKKLIVITGASSGFGLEMAKLYSEAGYPTLLLARRVELIEQYNFPNSMCLKVDVSNYEEFTAAITKAEAKFGPVDLLINNAGVMLLGQLGSQDISEFKTMLDVNVLGVLNGMSAVIEGMKSRNSGTIINVSSIAGFKAFGNHAAYCATKFGVHGLTETVRQEVSGHNVRVLLLSPGAAETELLSHTTSQEIVDGYNEWKKIMDEEKGLDPKVIALCSKFMYEVDQSVSIRELVIADTKQDA